MKGNTMKIQKTQVVSEFKENEDFFRMKNGDFWTVEALQRKYECSAFHVYDKAKLHNVQKMTLLGKTLYHDNSEIFTKRMRNGLPEKLKENRTVQYAELCAEVRQLKAKIEEMTVVMSNILSIMTQPKLKDEEKV